MSSTEALERLAADLLPAAGDGNAVVSPYNVAAALALLAPGARGETASELERVLGPEAPPALPQAHVATAGWASPLLNVLRAYRDEVAALGAALAEVDFARPAEAAATINAWVAERTGGRITDLIAASDLDPDWTRLVLTAALYFKAAWEEPFERVGPRPFEMPTGSVDREFMARQAVYGYAELPGVSAIRLPYEDGTTSLELLVPDDLATFEGDLAANLAAARVAMRRAEVELELPLFAVRARSLLKAALEAAGLATAFDPDAADFTGITRDEKLCVDQVIHEALVEVDEKGTVATAATAVVVRAVSLTVPRRMVVDRPFAFVLRGPEEAPLFVGRVVDPQPDAGP